MNSWRSRIMSAGWVVVASLSLLVPCGLARAESGPFLVKENMDELKCEGPDKTNRFLGSSAPGQLFLTSEPVNVKLALSKGANVGTVAFTLEVQEIGTRTPGRVVKGMAGFSDTVGHAPIIDVIGKPVAHPLKVTFTDQPEVEVDVPNLPVPARFGTYAIILCQGDKRQFLGSVARVPSPRSYGTVENTPVFGEGQFMGGDITTKAAIYGRMGIRGWRSELSWTEKEDGTTDWASYDKLFAAAKQSGCKIMVTLGGHALWKWPFKTHQTPAAVSHLPNWDGNAYWGQCDWLCGPELYPRYEKWIVEFCKRYWENGGGGLWGLENFNEPWEGGGISGWARDCLQYREIQKTIARAARSVDPKIKLLAASSIMNTEDKLFSDGSKEFESYVDIFTDHYVPPCMCYGPMVAAARGKESMETETWVVGTEFQLPPIVAQFMAAGQKRIAPWHPRALFESVPGGKDQTMVPTPVVAATAAFNYFVTGKSFEKMVFMNHLPWVFQFGKDTDKDALMVLFGQLIPSGSENWRECIWAQVNGAAGGTMTIDNRDGLLKFFDLSGNAVYEGEKTIRLPMSIFPSYITCSKGPVAAAERLAQMKIEGKRPVEILPRDFSTLLTATNATLKVDVHNCLNRSVSGRLAVKTPPELTLAAAEQAVTLAAGETRTIAFAVSKAVPNENNAYPCVFQLSSDAGPAEYAETMTVAVAPKAKISIDGNLDDWKHIPSVAAFASKDKIDPAELMRRPWLQVQGASNEVVAGRVKLAWDDKNVYVCAEVKDKTAEEKAIRFGDRDENAYFHTKASDEKEPFKRFLATTKGPSGKSLKEEGRSFAEVPYVYANAPEAGIPFRRDRLQVAFDTSDDWHDLQATTNSVPYGFHAVPDTDYEYSLYLCGDGKGEVWRQLAPGVPRIHDFPRQPRGKLTTGAVKDARFVVTRTDAGYVYEGSIPKSELATVNLAAGTDFGFTFKIGNSGGAQPEYGNDKAVCKQNGLTLHPYWERSPSCGVRWTLVE
jgi:hypothetical protein